MPSRRLNRLLAATLLSCSSLAMAQAVQEHVHGHGGDVIPFDLVRTRHVFQMTEDGGIQQVLMRNDAADPEQLRLIRHHLAMEAAAFQKGDFTDPARLHGVTMLKLKELRSGAKRVQITYRPLPAALNYIATDGSTHDIEYTAAG